MEHDRTSGKRVNWLLIKHCNCFAGEEETEALLQEDSSVASGRSVSEIAAGKGRKPRPFMVPKTTG